MSVSKLPLEALEAFEATARTGSSARAAGGVGLPISAASHHLSRLEASLGTALLDRTRRPTASTRSSARRA
jgi:DNA-binding transcriptional LysR family regulator